MENLNFNIGSEFYPNYLNRIPYSWFQFLNSKFLLSSTLGSAAFDTVVFDIVAFDTAAFDIAAICDSRSIFLFLLSFIGGSVESVEHW